LEFDCKKMHPKCQAMCCGIVPIPKEIWERNQDKLVRECTNVIDATIAMIPVTESHYCPFLNEDLSCNIYEDRPEVCKKFGDESHPMLRCAFLDKNGKERSRQAQRHEIRKIEKKVNKLKVIDER